MCVYCTKRPRRKSEASCHACYKSLSLHLLKGRGRPAKSTSRKPWYWRAEAILHWRGVWVIQVCEGGDI